MWAIPASRSPSSTWTSLEKKSMNKSRSYLHIEKPRKQITRRILDPNVVRHQAKASKTDLDDLDIPTAEKVINKMTKDQGKVRQIHSEGKRLHSE